MCSPNCFEQCRISEIQENTDPVSWSHCSGEREILDFESSSDYKISLEKVHYLQEINPGSQSIAPLPDVCVTESPPFSVVGIDFAGPLFVKDSDAKQYILTVNYLCRNKKYSSRAGR
ncbi:hypothetical protein TNCV_1413451 [Trichonephila clavipes]|nr:hypothetical protein TNCV_1413451 [Trichonephila clavipes]